MVSVDERDPGMPIRRRLAYLTAAAALAMTCGRSPLEIDYGVPTPGTAGSAGPGTAGSGGGAGATGGGGSTGGSVAAGTFGRGGTFGSGGSAAAGTFGHGGTVGSGGGAAAGTFGRGGTFGRAGTVGSGGRGTAGTFGRGGTVGSGGAGAGRGGTSGSAGVTGSITCPAIIDGSLDTTDPTQTGRVSRIPPAGICTLGKSYPGNQADPFDPHLFDVYRFVNPTTSSACFNFTLTYDRTGGVQRYLTAYSTYDPINIGSGYLGDVGDAITSPQSMGITVAPRSSIDVVVIAIDVAPSGIGPYSLRCDTTGGTGGRGGMGGVVDGGAGVGGSAVDGGAGVGGGVGGGTGGFVDGGVGGGAAGVGGSSGGTGGQPPIPIPCGRMSCVPGVEACCIRQNGSSCIKAGATCPGGASISCLDATVCSGGNLCCLSLSAGATSCVSESTCTAAGDAVLCSSPAHCPGRMPNCCREGPTGVCSAQPCL
jgi:hypothetical protein